MAKFNEVVGALETLRLQVPSTSIQVSEATLNESTKEINLNSLVPHNDVEIDLVKDVGDQMEEDSQDENEEDSDSVPPGAVRDHVMTRDSYGKLR